jgi:hypothetical protein
MPNTRESLATKNFQQRNMPPPDITNPGPDTENFPLSPFTLPQGRVYWESFPLYFELLNSIKPYTYYWPFLLRLGVTDILELRFSGLGLTAQYGIDSQQQITGFSPVEIGIKLHLYGTPAMRWAPSCGIEAAIIPPLASKKFKDATQFRITALFYHTFTKQLSLEWNIGTYSNSFKHEQKRKFFALMSWALEYDILKHIGFFIEGLYDSQKNKSCHSTMLLGIGFISNITKRICIYGSYNWPIHHNGFDVANLGFAVAF